MKNQRNAAFDVAKFLAMYLVVLGHLLNERAGNPAFLINLFHMPVLFFISGYMVVSSIEKRSVGSVLKKKAGSLLIPYIFWSGVSLLANTALSSLNGTVSIKSVLGEASQIFLYARSVWFLVELFATFLIFLAVHKVLLMVGWKKYTAPAYCVMWILLACFVPGELFAFYKFKWLFPFFLAGYFSGGNAVRLAERVSVRKWCRAIEWASLSFPVLALVFVQEDAFWGYTKFEYYGVQSVLYGFLYYGISAVGVIFLLTLARWISKCAVGRICAEIGTYSMDIYVIHMFLIKFIPIPVNVEATGKIATHGILAITAMIILLLVWVVSKWILRRFQCYRIVVGVNRLAYVDGLGRSLRTKNGLG